MSNKSKVIIETYGCQMNFSDSEIVASVLNGYKYESTTDISEAQLILLNTCSIRDNAEKRIWRRLKELNALKKRNHELIIGVIGCMAERLKDELLASGVVDLVAGPDAYRDLPSLLVEVENGQKAANIILSEEETYDNIEPVRLSSNGVSAFISIMRGCENFCTYCVVPYTRGKERSRDPQTIIDEAKKLFDLGYREITLLGQNVNSYRWKKDDDLTNFPILMQRVADIDPLLRVRFTTSHPKDISDELIDVIAENENICNFIHLAAQSGNNRILKLMNRKYTHEYFLERVAAIRAKIPNCAISTDIIAGFCTETEAEHKDTLSLMQSAAFNYAFMFKYSERGGTVAAKRFEDDIEEEIKSRRLQEIIALQRTLSEKSNENDIGKKHRVLVEGVSKRSDEMLFGRNSQNKVIVFPKANHKAGDYVDVVVTDCTSATLIAELVGVVSK